MAAKTGPRAAHWISATCAAVLGLIPFAAGAQAISSEPLTAPPGLTAPNADTRVAAPARPSAPIAAAEPDRAAQPAPVKSVSSSEYSTSALGHSTPGSVHKRATKKVADASKVKKHKPLTKTADAGKTKPKHKALKPKTAAPGDGANS